MIVNQLNLLNFQLILCLENVRIGTVDCNTITKICGNQPIGELEVSHAPTIPLPRPKAAGGPWRPEK